MKEYKKSAKDIAFDKERAKFRKEIRELESRIDKEQKKVMELVELVSKKDIVISQQKEWIERLLEYTELSEEDMKKLIAKEKSTAEIVEHLASMQRIFGRFGSFV